MSVTSANRARATRKVMNSLAANSVTLELQAEDGSFPVVVALPNEYVNDVGARVESAGGQVNLIVAFADQFRVLVMRSGDAAAPFVGDDSSSVNRTMSLGMLLTHLDNGRLPGGSFTTGDATVIRSPQTAVEFSY